MEAVDLKGPCMAPIEIQFDGTLQAPADPNALDGADEWLKVQHVNFFTLSGKGVLMVKVQLLGNKMIVELTRIARNVPR